MAVCSYCKSIIVRHDQNLKNLGITSDMPEDLSPLQIGSLGIYKKENFEIVGRQKILYPNGTWNEWYILFKNGNDGWLAEAQGDYMVSFEKRNFNQFPKLSSLTIGTSINIDQILFLVDDIKQIVCNGSEGELPFQAEIGRKSTSIDLVSSNNDFANFDYGENESHLFLGSYVEFESLQLGNLRQLEGW